jgi:hypothetical protein
MRYCFVIVLVSLLAASGVVSQTSSQPPAAQKAEKIDSRAEFLEASKERVIKDSGLRPLNASAEVERIILEEAQAIDRVAGFNTTVGLTDGGGTFSHPMAGIGLDMEELQRIRRKSNVAQFRYFLRLILAHEKSHQVQYLRYSRSAVKNAPPEQRRIYECQADILAGKFLVESFEGPSEEVQQAILDALRVAFDIGTEEYTADADHPSREGRRTAVRLGMGRGMITVYERLPRAPFLDSVMASLAGKTHVLPGEDVMGWSFRLAKKIIHYSREASAGVRLENQSVEWDRRPGTPFVTYSLTYKNAGPRTVKIDMEVQCVMVPGGDDESKTLRSQKWSNQNYAFILRPGETYVVKGTLLSGCTVPLSSGLCTDYSGLKPTLVFPPDPTALMSCEYVE